MVVFIVANTKLKTSLSDPIGLFFSGCYQNIMIMDKVDLEYLLLTLNSCYYNASFDEDDRADMYIKLANSIEVVQRAIEDKED